MKTINQVVIFLICVIFVSCSQQTIKKTDNENQSSTVNVDSLNAVFLAGWNKKDSAAIMNTISENAIVMNDSLIHSGISSIAKNWISGGVKVLSNVKTKSLIKDANGKIAFDGGTYTLDLTIPGGPTFKERGNYSLVWTKQLNNQWKLTLVHIEDITRLPDIK
jgi:ketosteroid isomerase-like protein